jgi:tetratricopeptide (TPR) repeat protein
MSISIESEEGGSSAQRWIDKAQEFSDLNRHDEALEAATKATEADSENVAAWMTLVLRGLNRRQEALEAATKATDLDPEMHARGWRRGFRLAD